MKTYIYGESFIKTRKNIYCIKSYNMVMSDKIIFDFYILVNSYNDQKGKTNTFGSIESKGKDCHISQLRQGELLLFNRINEKSKLYQALKKRINFND
jgi:hypothetical protein